MIELSLAGLALAFAGGLISFLSPCVLPLVPGYLAWVAGADLERAQRERTRTLLLGAFFVLGFSLVFIALGAAATGLSGLLRRWSGEAALIGGALVLAMGLVQMGLLRMPAPLLRDLRPGFHRISRMGGTPGAAMLVGAAFAFGWTPCIGPVLGAVFAASAVGLANGVTLLAAYSAGLGLPFLLAALYLPVLMDQGRRRGLHRFGASLQRGAGLIVSIMGLALMTGQLTYWSAWMLQTFPALARIG